MEAIQFIIDLLDEYIINKVFDREEKFLKRLPYIILYFLIVIITGELCIFIGINYIMVDNIFGYFLTGFGIIFLILLITLFFIKK